MEHPDQAPLADDGEHSATPNDQPLGGPSGPEDENMPARPLADDGPQEPSPQREPSG